MQIILFFRLFPVCVLNFLLQCDQSCDVSLVHEELAIFEERFDSLLVGRVFNKKKVAVNGCDSFFERLTRGVV